MKTFWMVRWFAAIAFLFLATTGYCDPAFISSVKSGPYPWTHTRFPQAGSDFHFAVVADRSGGCRAGVFEAAVAKLNLLRPAMVMSVGDYIEGYTDEVGTLQTQWAEVVTILKDLQAPFFFLPGNHDYGLFGSPQTAIDATAKVWHAMRGPTYYWFIHKNTLFLCLNSMGGQNHRWGLGDAQLAFANEVLTAHPNVRWTFVFLHNPLWAETGADIETPSRFSELENALAGRNYTVFAGHCHKYSRYDRQGMKYFTLSVTGGISDLSGPNWGEFDQIMWVSMTDTGPQFSNLALGGILSDDVCTPAVVNLKESTKFIPAENDKTKNGSAFSFSFKNTFTTPLKVSMKWKNDAGCSIQPAEKRVTVPPGAVCSSTFRIQFNDNAPLTMPILRCGFLAGKFQATRDCIPSIDCLGASGMNKWMEKMTRTAVRVNRSPKIDGKLDDSIWQQPPAVDGFSRFDFSAVAEPSTRVWFAYDDRNLYVAWRCDEGDMKTLVANIDQLDGQVWTDDSVEMLLDTTRNRTDYFYFGLNCRGTLYDNRFGSGNGNFNSGAHVAVSRNGDCWTAELSVAWKDLNTQPPKVGTRMGFELARQRPRAGTMEDTLSQFPPLGSAQNHQPKFFGILVFGK